MRTSWLLALLASVILPLPALAVPGTCTIRRMDVVGTFPFNNVGGDGTVLPVDIDPATGRFTIGRDPWAAEFPAPGLEFRTGFGPNGYLGLASGTVEGTIDGNGVAAFPGFTYSFGTDFQGPIVTTDMTATLTSGVRVNTRSPGENILFVGRPMEANGNIRLVGANILNLIIVNLTGPGITCSLDPVPDLSSLPAGPSVVAVKGKGKLGPETETPDDEATWRVVLANGATAPPLDGTGDLVLRFGRDSGTVLALLVRGSAFTVKGKKSTAVDVDGSVIQQAFQVDVQSKDGLVIPPKIASGKVTVKRAKKRTTITVAVQGVDLSKLDGTMNVTVSAGDQTAFGQTTISAGKKGPKFK